MFPASHGTKRLDIPILTLCSILSGLKEAEEWALTRREEDPTDIW